ncbi:hypothetical protein LIA77_07562 [Sarocladium implicatum]|nr:hypothetical protein LIA77_07562 [Sarocladium implicatum]
MPPPRSPSWKPTGKPGLHQRAHKWLPSSATFELETRSETPFRPGTKNQEARSQHIASLRPSSFRWKEALIQHSTRQQWLAAQMSGPRGKVARNSPSDSHRAARRRTEFARARRPSRESGAGATHTPMPLG